MPPTITDEQLRPLGKYLEGSSNTLAHALTVFEWPELDEAEVQDALCGYGLELCKCGWWVESHELIDDDCNVVGCEDCRKES